LVTPALAATTFSFSPSSISIRAGDIYNLKVIVHPHGVKNYTVMAQIQYPADLLEIKTFNFGNGWTALSQSGYDLIDNKNGLLIKTAGYPGGISDSVIFGTISFAAKKAGDGVIRANGDSLAFDATSQNVFVGPLAQTVVLKAVQQAPAPAPEASPLGEKKAAALEPQAVPTFKEATLPAPEITPEPRREIIPGSKEKQALFDIAIEPEAEKSQKNQTATIALVACVGLVVSGAVGCFVYKRRRPRLK